MVYMLVGFAPQETIEEILYRYRRLTERGCKVFPMVYQPWRGEEDGETADSEKDNPEADMKEREERERNAQLRKFQRWVIQRYSQFIPWEKIPGKTAAGTGQIPAELPAVKFPRLPSVGAPPGEPRARQGRSTHLPQDTGARSLNGVEGVHGRIITQPGGVPAVKVSQAHISIGRLSPGPTYHCPLAPLTAPTIFREIRE